MKYMLKFFSLKWLSVLILTLAIITTTSRGAYCNSEENLVLDRKDPFLAGALSFYNPGLGQFYAGENAKGIVFWLTENAFFFSALFTVMDLSVKLKKDFGFEFSISQKTNLSTERIVTSVSLGLAFIILHIYNIIDAVNSAKEYNARQEEKLFMDNQMGIHVELTDQSDMFFLSYSFKM